MGLFETPKGNGSQTEKAAYDRLKGKLSDMQKLGAFCDKKSLAGMLRCLAASVEEHGSVWHGESASFFSLKFKVLSHPSLLHWH